MNSDRLRQLLLAHVVKVWFPRCFDPAGPGLSDEFGPDWSPILGRPRLLEFSTRQPWMGGDALSWVYAEAPVQLLPSSGCVKVQPQFCSYLG